MLASLSTTRLLGVDAHQVHVAVDISPGLPSLSFLGLGDDAQLAVRDRLRAAFANSGLDWPDGRITVCLLPARPPGQGSGGGVGTIVVELPQQLLDYTAELAERARDVRARAVCPGPPGQESSFDLPVAIGVLAAAGHVPTRALHGLWAVGELGLGGDVRPVRGVLATARAARAGAARTLLVPSGNLAEAGLVFRVVGSAGATTLAEVAQWLRGQLALQGPRPSTPAPPAPSGEDLADVHGQPAARRALEIAAAGGHPLLLVGPSGSGKTMLARCLPGLLPELTSEEALEATQVHSAAGLVLADAPLVTARPFRAPHHSISLAGLLGGGSRIPRPGEVSLAHLGVLFLDELHEFGRMACEALYQPLDNGQVTVVRTGVTVRYPAQVAFVAATTPCACGQLGDPKRPCHCSPEAVYRHMRRLPDPLLDRIDLVTRMDRVGSSELQRGAVGESSAVVRARVRAARALALQRATVVSPRLSLAALERVCQPTEGAHQMLRGAVHQLDLSLRGFHSVLRVARTIADLALQERVDEQHVREALGLRRFPVSPGDQTGPA